MTRVLGGLLLAHGAGTGRPRREGRGAAEPLADTDLFLAACQRTDREAVQEQLTRDPGLPGLLGEAEQARSEAAGAPAPV